MSSANLYKRLDAMFDDARKAAAERAPALKLGPFAEKTEARLVDFETRFAASIERFSSIREAFAQTEAKIMEAADRIDSIWADHDSRGIGGWRTVMRSVSTYVEKHGGHAEDLGRFRGTEQTRGPSQPPISNFPCPQCHKLEVRRLHRNTLFEEVLRIVAVAPYRCHSCSTKFYRMRRHSRV